MRWLAGAGTAAAVVMAAPPLAGQEISVRVGGVHTQYADSVRGSAAALTARAAWESDQLSGLLDGTYTQFTSGTWVAQLGGAFSGVHLVRRHLGIGFHLVGDGGYLQNDVWSGTVSAGPFAAVVAGNWLFGGGASAGAVRRVDRASDGTLIGDGQARYQRKTWSVEADVQGTRAGPIAFTDVTLSAGVRLASLGIGGLAGARTGGLGGKPWLQGRADWTFSRWGALEAVVGSYPPDLSGFTGGLYVSVGVWLGRPGLAHGARASQPMARPPESVVIDSVDSARSVATFVVPGARTVAIAGPWNDWSPSPLERRDRDRWRAVLPLGEGTYRFSLVVNGTRWMVPPGVATLPDGFGGTVGVLVVER